jgi:hypothetical protein
MKTLGVAMSLILLAAGAWAQEAATDEADERPQPPRTQIRVLQHPHDLASFYRSSQGTSAPEFGAYPLTDRASMTERYPLAGFYRQGGGQGGRYSRYWTSSAGPRRGYLAVRTRRVGTSDLCLLAPTFLAPAAPFTDFDR